MANHVDHSESVACEIFELYTNFSGSSRDHYADPKQDSFSLDLCGQPIVLSQDGRLQMGKGVTGCRVWDASVVLAKFIEHQGLDSIKLSNEMNCIELGAGCGLPGMATALLGVPTVLTDQEFMLPHLQRCVDQNSITHRLPPREKQPKKFKSRKKKNAACSTGPRLIECCELEWEDDTALTNDALHPRLPFDLVLCADLAYNEDVNALLIEMLLRVTTPKTLVLFCMELRASYVLEDLLLRLLSTGFNVSRVPPEMFHPDFCPLSVVLFAIRRKEGAAAVGGLFPFDAATLSLQS